MLQKLLVMTSAFVCLFLFFDCGQAQQEERAPEGVIYKEKRVPSVIATDQENSFRNVSITLRHFGEKFRLQQETRRPLPAAAAGS